MYSGPSGPYAVDPGNPARTSVILVAKTGWYAYWLDGFQVQSATTDDMLNRDGWGDEVFLTIDVLETGPTGKQVSAAGAQGLIDMKSVLGNPGTRPIGMAANGSFTPRAVVLTYELPENSLSRAWLNQPAGTANINYKEPPSILNGEYTLKGRIVRVANPQECRQ